MAHKQISVLLISVDALNPEFIFRGKGLGNVLPNIKNLFVDQGTYAGQGVKSVFPTFTYPCHQSIITGVNPATHGTVNNGIFDPLGEHKGAWYWFASKKATNLWEASKAHGYLAASVAFPTSAGVAGDYIAPEFWWDGSALDSCFIDALSCPQGLVAEMEQDIGRFAGGLDLTEAGDRQRFRAAMWILRHKLYPLRKKKPFFMSAYFASFDESAHQYGVHSKEAAHSLQLIDEMVGELAAYVRQITGGQCAVCLVSDHGMLDNRFNINPNVLLREAGLISVDEEGGVTAWKAWSQRAGGTAELRLREQEDAASRQKLEQILTRLAKDPESGIAQLLDREEAVGRGGFPEADFVLVSKPGYEIRDQAAGPYLTEQLHQRAQHGYSEELPEMRAVFLITGAGIPAAHDMGALNLIDIAPTLAEVMGFTLPQAEGVSRMAAWK